MEEGWQENVQDIRHNREVRSSVGRWIGSKAEQDHGDLMKLGYKT